MAAATALVDETSALPAKDRGENCQLGQFCAEACTFVTPLAARNVCVPPLICRRQLTKGVLQKASVKWRFRDQKRHLLSADGVFRPKDAFYQMPFAGRLPDLGGFSAQQSHLTAEQHQGAVL